jgi:hypothetical protein
MRNESPYSKHYPAETGLSRTSVPTAVLLPLSLAVAAAVLTAGSAPRQAVGAAAPPEAPSLVLPGRPSPALAATFLPRGAPAGAYRLAVIDAPIEAAAAQVRAALVPDAKVDDPPGAWVVRFSDPLDAFGEAGTYNRTRLARLFTGRPAQLVRAPVARSGRVVASVTLIAPVPDSALTTLSPGTLAILFVVPAGH